MTAHEPEVGARLDRHLVAGIGVLVAHATGDGALDHNDGIHITAVGRGGSEFNTALVTGPPQDPATAVTRARDLLAATGCPYMIQVPEPLHDHVADGLTAAGLHLRESVPGMVRPAPTEIPPPPDGLRIRRVETEDELRAHAVAAATGFGVPDPTTGIDVFPASLLGDTRIAMFNGYVDGAATPAATSVCVVAEGLAGIYAVAVHPPMRQRRMGTAMTWAAMSAGACAGADLCVLQASEMGAPVYTRMGFRTVRTYLRFVPEDTAT